MSSNRDKNELFKVRINKQPRARLPSAVLCTCVCVCEHTCSCSCLQRTAVKPFLSWKVKPFRSRLQAGWWPGATACCWVTLCPFKPCRSTWEHPGGAWKGLSSCSESFPQPAGGDGVIQGEWKHTPGLMWQALRVQLSPVQRLGQRGQGTNSDMPTCARVEPALNPSSRGSVAAGKGEGGIQQFSSPVSPNSAAIRWSSKVFRLLSELRGGEGKSQPVREGWVNSNLLSSLMVWAYVSTQQTNSRLIYLQNLHENCFMQLYVKIQTTQCHCITQVNPKPSGIIARDKSLTTSPGLPLGLKVALLKMKNNKNPKWEPIFTATPLADSQKLPKLRGPGAWACFCPSQQAAGRAAKGVRIGPASFCVCE